MKIFQKLSGAALLSAALLFTACSKDKDPGNSVTPAAPSNQKTCRLTKEIHDSYYAEYLYNSNGKISKINHKTLYDSALLGGYRYTYNAAGKAAEEVRFSADSIAIGKRVFTYNANNFLTQIDFYDIPSSGGVAQLSHHILFQHNAAGQRILMQEYSNSQLYSYTQYTYTPNYILAKIYNAQTTPATLNDSIEFHYDNMKSIDSALGYLHEYWPENDKHNMKMVKTLDSWSSFYYQYNHLGYPIQESSLGPSGPAYNEIIIYEYDCQ